MKTIYKNSILVVSVLLMLLAYSGSALADGQDPASCRKNFLGIPHWGKYLDFDDKCVIIPPAEGGQVVLLVMFGIFDIILFLAGFIAFIMLVYGGFKFLTSTGEPQKIAAARTTILNALVGILITFVASNIVGFIAGSLS